MPGKTNAPKVTNILSLAMNAWSAANRDPIRHCIILILFAFVVVKGGSSERAAFRLGTSFEKSGL
jgi:hypothetical protein